jgi:hypothetical protein
MTMVPSMSLVHGADDVALDVAVHEADELHRLSVDKNEDVAVNVAVFETHGGALILMRMMSSSMLLCSKLMVVR